MTKQSLQENVQNLRELSIPEEINSSNAKLIYVYMKSVTTATLEQICSALSMKKITLYPIISTLKNKGFITKSNNVYKIAN